MNPISEPRRKTPDCFFSLLLLGPLDTDYIVSLGVWPGFDTDVTRAPNPGEKSRLSVPLNGLYCACNFRKRIANPYPRPSSPRGVPIPFFLRFEIGASENAARWIAKNLGTPNQTGESYLPCNTGIARPDVSLRRSSFAFARIFRSRRLQPAADASNFDRAGAPTGVNGEKCLLFARLDE